jgi:hypothetical protein
MVLHWETLRMPDEREAQEQGYPGLRLQQFDDHVRAVDSCFSQPESVLVNERECTLNNIQSQCMLVFTPCTTILSRTKTINARAYSRFVNHDQFTNRNGSKPEENFGRTITNHDARDGQVCMQACMNRANPPAVTQTQLNMKTCTTHSSFNSHAE